MTASTKPDRQAAAASEARSARLLVGIIGGSGLYQDSYGRRTGSG